MPALLLIKKGEEKIHYFDFGRYISPPKYGRVRNELHDIELRIPIKAKWKKEILLNRKEILLFFGNNPEITHGDGRLVASFCEDINFKKAYNFINKLIKKEFIKYDIKGRNTTNCSRFVYYTIYNSITSKKIKRRMLYISFITPSPVGVVIKSSTDKKIYNVKNQEIKKLKKGYLWRMLKEFLLKNFEIKDITNYYNPVGKSPFKNGHWLGGEGDGKWYSIEHKGGNNFIGRKNILNGEILVIELISEKKIDLTKDYQITYPSNDLFFTINQNGENIKLIPKL